MQRRPSGELALVLHTHMPYVEGFGTWPFGEEWLWEAIATSYLPLLDVLGTAPITLSLTPVLCDQLEAPGAMARCVEFLNDIRPASHRLDADALRAAGKESLVAEIERSAAEYAAAAERLEQVERSGGLLAALGAHATWTSSATHAILPLLTSETGAALQVQTGIAAHRRRFAAWGGGFWLPECAHAQWLNPVLEEAGVRAVCVELTGIFGLGDPRHLQPLATDDGPVLWPIDRQTIDLVWGEAGYPSNPEYRDYHRTTPRDHRVWNNAGGRYDADRAAAAATADARDFVARVKERVSAGGVCVCAVDTELLGHWWYEGVRWLAAVIEETDRQGLRMTTLDDAFGRAEPMPAPAEMAPSSWGAGGDLRTWSGPVVADLAWQARTAELSALASERRPSDRALRELLALQSSDWAFLMTTVLAGEYPRERARHHAEMLALALGGRGRGGVGGRWRRRVGGRWRRGVRSDFRCRARDGA
jgi:1,4-alpha-glucan branching enzyme